jgi:hypothetical protein
MVGGLVQRVSATGLRAWYLCPIPTKARLCYSLLVSGNEGGLLNSVRKRAESLIARELDDGILLLDMDAAKIHQLNASAGFIWRHCDGVASVADIAALVAREYQVDEGPAAKDVEMALSELRALNLVVEG